MPNNNLSTRYPKFRKAKTDIFGRLDKIKVDTERMMPELAPLSHQQLVGLLAACRRYHEGSLHFGRRSVKSNVYRVRELTTTEHAVYEYLRREWSKFSPSTIYRWALAGRLPSDIKEELEAGKIGQIRALKLAQNRFDRQKDGKAVVILDMVTEAVENMLKVERRW